MQVCVDSRRAPTLKTVEGEKDMKARLMARGYPDPDRRGGLVEASRSTCTRSSHLQVLALGALKKWGKWSRDITKASLRADGFQREVFLCAQAEWGPSGTHRIWRRQVPPSVLNNEPAAFRKTL